jgi:GR25 family glycosyltransferase involved in LPS biosynthesis
MFDTYVINLQKDYDRYERLKYKLAEKNIYCKRFDAVYGKEIVDFKPYDKFISSYCKYFCPRGLVGCGLSHMILMDKIYTQSDNKFSLILEDDVEPLFDDKKQIDNIINGLPDDCDIMMLHCMGQCEYKDRTRIIKNTKWIASCAAYLVRNSSIPKIIKNKLITHIDLQIYSNQSINTYIWIKPLFETDNSHSYNKDSYTNNIISNISIPTIDGMSVGDMVSFKIFRLPFIGIELSGIGILIICIIIYIIYNIII